MSESKVIRLSQEQINLIMFAFYDKLENNFYRIKCNDRCIDAGIDVKECKSDNYLTTSNIEYYREIAKKLGCEISFNAIFEYYNNMSLENLCKITGKSISY